MSATPDAPQPYQPAWVREFARLYFTKTISQFILHGNIVDVVRQEGAGGQAEYLKFKDYLTQQLFKKRDIVLTYDRASGLGFGKPDTRKDFLTFLDAFDSLNRTSYSKAFPRDPAEVLGILEKYLMVRLNDGKKIAVLLDYAETLVPMTAGGSSSGQDRALLVQLMKWAKESIFLNSDMTVVLMTGNLNSIHQQLVRDPYTRDIDIPYPDHAERLLFIQHHLNAKQGLAAKLEMSPEVLAHNTAGLNLVQLRTLLAEVAETAAVFSHDDLTRRKKDIIETEAGGLLEFVESKYNLDSVAGHAAAKQHLRHAAQAIKNGRSDVMPMGYLVNGPVGTGKTFMVSCFAADIGVPMVMLKNFRSMWQGETEANLEKVLKLLKAMSPVAVMIDEADASLGNRNSSGDSGVSSRVFSMIATFMSNTENRGRIIWFLLTARPDLMPVDLKRQGRAEEHIALFYPETVAERKELFEVMLKKTKIKNLKPDDFGTVFFETMKINSGADMEGALTRAKFKAVAAGLTEVSPEVVKEVFDDFVPPTYPEEVELMNLAAVLECTSRELLPERYRHMNRAEVAIRVEELKRKIR